ncbi:hypothetical protein M404DRAFT_713520 [Pisolithus tinctorius Marx 270]|uniref:Uncharacterized protein n=1 Tax=Pisolithus tinctorius Marx 270 TaxID=870435 RepID=A0A0C3P3T2_PISTI|nr:hypothetical protein M404DRAFT_713520 [Pisolithus tinctorius Marx 270]
MFSGSSGSLRAWGGTHDNGSSFALLSGPDHRLHNPAYARTREVQYTTITTRRASVQGSRTLFALTDSDTFSCINSQSGEVVDVLTPGYILRDVFLHSYDARCRPCDRSHQVQGTVRPPRHNSVRGQQVCHRVCQHPHQLSNGYAQFRPFHTYNCRNQTRTLSDVTGGILD